MYVRNISVAKTYKHTRPCINYLYDKFIINWCVLTEPETSRTIRKISQPVCSNRVENFIGYLHANVFVACTASNSYRLCKSFCYCYLVDVWIDPCDVLILGSTVPHFFFSFFFIKLLFEAPQATHRQRQWMKERRELCTFFVFT